MPVKSSIPKAFLHWLFLISDQQRQLGKRGLESELAQSKANLEDWSQASVTSASWTEPPGCTTNDTPYRALTLQLSAFSILTILRLSSICAFFSRRSPYEALRKPKGMQRKQCCFGFLATSYPPLRPKPYEIRIYEFPPSPRVHSPQRLLSKSHAMWARQQFTERARTRGQSNRGRGRTRPTRSSHQKASSRTPPSRPP